MNWRRGLLRLWLLASILWVAFAGVVFDLTTAGPALWHSVGSEQRDAACFADPEAYKKKNPFDCFDDEPSMSQEEARNLVVAFVAAGIGVPVGAVLAFFALVWVGRGFR
ncbi:MAG TPA: hypothetical protein VF957_23600 [Bradyrhizobium sp.]